MSEYLSPFRFRYGEVRKDVVAKQAIETGRILDIGTAEHPGTDLPHCNKTRAAADAEAFDKLCAARPKLPPGRR